MSAVIKLTNTSYLKVLEELLYSKVHPFDSKIPLVKLPFSNFINLLVTIFSQYAQQGTITNINLFILNYFQKTYESPYEVYRHLHGLIVMWKKYVESNGQARMYLSMLQPERSSRDNIRMFLKIRKNILRTIGPKVMEQIKLTHQDVITLVHTLFVTEMKVYASKKIHELFFALKKKSMNANKVNGAVICEFLINCIQKYERQELGNIRNEPVVQNKPFDQYIKRREVVPVDRRSSSPENERDSMSFGDDPGPIMGNTGKFTRPLESKPFQNNFMLNNLSSIETEGQKKSLTPEKSVLNSRYSYSWQKFIRTNQEMKKKLLHSRHDI